MKKFLQIFFSELGITVLNWLKSLREILAEIACGFRMPPLPEGKTAEPQERGRLKAFIEKYMGRNIDFDGAFGYTCVDLVRQYIKEALQVPQPEPTGMAGASAFYFQHEARPVQARHFDLATYNPRMVPPDGAIVVFNGTQANRFGHIGICINADERGINLFEQDGFRQSPAAMRRWDYARVLGWLVPKEQG